MTQWLVVHLYLQCSPTEAWGPFDSEEAAKAFTPPPGTEDPDDVVVVPLIPRSLPDHLGVV